MQRHEIGIHNSHIHTPTKRVTWSDSLIHQKKRAHGTWEKKPCDTDDAACGGQAEQPHSWQAAGTDVRAGDRPHAEPGRTLVSKEYILLPFMGCTAATNIILCCEMENADGRLGVFASSACRVLPR